MDCTIVVVVCDPARIIFFVRDRPCRCLFDPPAHASLTYSSREHLLSALVSTDLHNYIKGNCFSSA